MGILQTSLAAALLATAQVDTPPQTTHLDSARVIEALQRHQTHTISDDYSWRRDKDWNAPAIQESDRKQPFIDRLRAHSARIREASDKADGLATFQESPVVPEISKPLLLVTHPSFKYDLFGSAAEGVNSTIRNFRQKTDGLAVYLIHDLSPESNALYYVEDRKPDYAVLSRGGEHAIRFSNPNVILAGGYFGGCLQGTLINALKGYSFSSPLKIHYPMKAVYANQRETLEEAFERLGKDPKAFAEKVASELYGILSEPGSYDWSRSQKLNELELSEFNFRILLNGKEIRRSGSGPKQVELHFYSEGIPYTSLREENGLTPACQSKAQEI